MPLLCFGARRATQRLRADPGRAANAALLRPQSALAVDVAAHADTDPEISALAGAVLYGDPLDLPTLDEMKMSYKFAKVCRQQNTIARAYFGEKRMKEVPRLKTHKAAYKAARKAARKAAPAYTLHGCKVFPKSNGGVRIVILDSDSDSE